MSLNKKALRKAATSSGNVLKQCFTGTHIDINEVPFNYLPLALIGMEEFDAEWILKNLVDSCETTFDKIDLYNQFLDGDLLSVPKLNPSSTIVLAEYILRDTKYLNELLSNIFDYLLLKLATYYLLNQTDRIPCNQEEIERISEQSLYVAYNTYPEAYNMALVSLEETMLQIKETDIKEDLMVILYIISEHKNFPHVMFNKTFISVARWCEPLIRANTMYFLPSERKSETLDYLRKTIAFLISGDTLDTISASLAKSKKLEEQIATYQTKIDENNEQIVDLRKQIKDLENKEPEKIVVDTNSKLKDTNKSLIKELKKKEHIINKERKEKCSLIEEIKTLNQTIDKLEDEIDTTVKEEIKQEEIDYYEEFCKSGKTLFTVSDSKIVNKINALNNKMINAHDTEDIIQKEKVASYDIVVMFTSYIIHSSAHQVKSFATTPDVLYYPGSNLDKLFKVIYYNVLQKG